MSRGQKVKTQQQQQNIKSLPEPGFEPRTSRTPVGCFTSATKSTESIKCCQATEFINIRWAFNFVYFVVRAIHDFKIPTKYLFTLETLHILRNPRIQVSTNMSNVVKPRNAMPTKLNTFTVFNGFDAMGRNVNKQSRLFSVIF